MPQEKIHDPIKQKIVATLYMLKAFSISKRTLRVFYDSLRGFIEDDCYSKGAVLTYYTLFSLVPLLAIFFGIAKGFGLEQALEGEIVKKFSEQKELMDKLIQFAYSWLQTVKGDLIAGVGVLVLFWSSLSLLSSMENALNDIWKIPYPRGWSRRISDYLATLVICPFFLLTSSSLMLWLTHLSEHPEKNSLLETFNPLLVLFLKGFPFFLSALLFAFLYFFLPNAKIYLRSALLAGAVAGVVFQFWQWLYIKFQIGASSYGAIYGSFAALPLFLIWLQISWFILLWGAELAFQIENDLFIPSRRSTEISLKAAALLITLRCIESFVKGAGPQTERTLAHELGISLSHLHRVLNALLASNILSAITHKGGVIGYQPGRAVEHITFAEVCLAVEKAETFKASIEDSASFQKIIEDLKKSEGLIKKASFNTPLYSSLK